MHILAFERVLDASEVFEERPELRNLTRMVVFRDGLWRFDLWGMVLWRSGVDIRCLTPYGEEWDVATDILLGDFWVTAFDFHAIGEIWHWSKSIDQFNELLDTYVETQERAPASIRKGRPSLWV